MCLSQQHIILFSRSKYLSESNKRYCNGPYKLVKTLCNKLKIPSDILHIIPNHYTKYQRGIPILPTPILPTPVSHTPISPTPILPTLKFYLIPISPTVDFCAIYCLLLTLLWLNMQWFALLYDCFLWWENILLAFDGIALHDLVIGVSILITFINSGVKSCFFPLKQFRCNSLLKLYHASWNIQCLRTVINQEKKKKKKKDNHHDRVGFTPFVNELQAYRSSFFYFKIIYLKVSSFIKYGRFT